VHVAKLHPGRIEENLAASNAAFDFIEAHGATNARLFQLLNAGSGAGLLMATWEHDSMAAYGRVMDAFGNDPAGQAISAAQLAPDPVSTPTFDGLYARIPL